MIDYIARHWNAMQQMRRERAEEERRQPEVRQPDINDWNNCESWSDFVNRAAGERHNAVTTFCLAVVALVIVLVLAVHEFDAALGIVAR